MAAMVGLRITGLTKRYGATAALVDVSLSAATGSVHALVGGNGSGKSTLIKTLAGVHTAEPGGRIQVGGDHVAADRISPARARRGGLSFVHQDLGLFDVLSVAENLVAGQPYPRRHGRIAWRRMRRDAQEALDHLGIAVRADAPAGALRPAERTLVAIARALQGREALHGGVLVLDEPTARLPEAEVETLLAALRRYAAAGQTILYVSHRLDEILAIGDAVTVLRDGRVAATAPASRLDEAGLARLIVGHAVAPVVRPAPTTAGARPVLELRGVTAGPLREVSLAVGEREILGVAGLVGSGRTSVLRAAYGALPATAGTVLVDGRPVARGSVGGAIRRGLGFVPEDRAAEGAFLGLGIPENLSAVAPGRHRRGLRFGHARERAAAGEALRAFAIRAPAVTAPLTALSGGNQQKVVLARWLTRRPRVLLLDEPTQGVDVGARADIHAQVRAAVDAGGAAVVVSSDVDELLDLADRIVVLAAGRVVDEAPAGEIDRHWLAERVYTAPAEVAA
jgi:ribose transport system ATP-binding protein